MRNASNALRDAVLEGHFRLGDSNVNIAAPPLQRLKIVAHTS